MGALPDEIVPKVTMLKDVDSGRVRSGVDARERTVLYVSGQPANRAQKALVNQLHIRRMIEPGAGGVYYVTGEGRTYLAVWRNAVSE